MPHLSNIPLSRSALLGVLTTIQNGPTFAHQDIMSFAGMCSTDEVSEHVLACFGRLTPEEKDRALAELRSRVAPAPAYAVAMVPQMAQQQQARARFEYERWRHGGWYVGNVQHPSGAVGCVSRNYPDGKWRIVCDPRPNAHALHTYRTRDEAAQAEADLIASGMGHGAPAMVPQPCQQQQGKASSFDPLCPVMDAAYFERMALKMADPAWPNTARLIAEAEVEIRESVARRAPELLAAAATLGIDAPLALTGRYSADPIPAPATAIDRAYADINALGGYVDRKDPEAVARDELLGEILTILERHGARDLPAALLQIAA